MKLILYSQKRTCKGCRAGKNSKCELGFDTKEIIPVDGAVWSQLFPLEPCFKPLTNEDYVYCLSNDWCRK